ncbi:DUF308 domain-containing protein [Pseudoflavonifractor sp. MCC625]|uniref:HdeD family acid-resistance protein n=1 Tax=Pseudoflavonifractor sp. MCC625 TaxID=2592647 RepID=UPI000C770181|nr:DUF308 domain-containing protein [Pseudoflavonifractor sp. MCC625]MBT9683756.1 hypothetical protein [Pseudoflavonifractor sp. MCC625]
MNPSSRPPYDIHDADYEQILDDLPAAPINRKSGLLSGLLLGGLGLFLLLSPIVAGVAIAYLITAGLLLYGISQTLAFFRVPKGERSGWSLLNGILLMLFAGLSMWIALSGPAGLFPLIESLSYAAGFLTASAGVIQISAFYALYKAKLSGAGWVLAGGILNLLLSVVILLNPIVSWFSLTALWGVYLLVSAIALSAESWSGRRAVRF